MGIDMISGSDGWIVGNYLTAFGGFVTLTEHCNGKKWKLVRSRNVVGAGNYLNSVSALSSDDVYAAGYVIEPELTKVIHPC